MSTTPPPKGNNPRAPYRCSFKATGEGTVFMQAWSNADDSPAHSYHYQRDGGRPAVSALTPRERREYNAAIKAEWGE